MADLPLVARSHQMLNHDFLSADHLLCRMLTPVVQGLLWWWRHWCILLLVKHGYCMIVQSQDMIRSLPLYLSLSLSFIQAAPPCVHPVCLWNPNPSPKNVSKQP